MKTIKYILLISVIFIACTKPESKLDITKAFYTACNEYNYSEIDKLTADTVTIIDGAYKKAYCKRDYYTLFQWDSVFHPHYSVEYIEQSNQDVFVKISTTSDRFAFLENNPLVTTHKISFNNNKISTIELNEYVATNFQIWVQKRDTLVNWVANTHPELNGFIYDMTKSGAENYKKAISLFQSTKQ